MSRPALAWLCVLAISGVASAQDSEPALGTLFSHEADVFAARPGLLRLDLPQEVLSRCRPDLSDLRVIDAAGAPIPYLIVRGITAEPTAERVKPSQARVLQAERFTEPSPTPPATARERFELAVPAGGAKLVLNLKTDASEFTRNVRVSYRPADGAPRLLAARTTLFRTPGAGEKLSLPLGTLDGGSLEIELVGQGAFLDPSFSFSPEPPPAEPLRVFVPLPVRETSREDHHTHVVLARPSGWVPSVLRFSTDTPIFERAVAVFDADANRRLSQLGAGKLARGPGLSAPLQIALAEASGDRLELVIDDQDSPPLQQLQVSAGIDRPALIFAAPDRHGEAPNAVLRFGGHRVAPPHYDVSALTEQLASGADKTRLLSALPAGQLGVVRDNPRFVAEAPLFTKIPAAAKLDVSAYAHRRRVEVPSAGEGVFRIVLDPQDLAQARSDLGDLRLVDVDGRQRPYLLVPASDALDVPLPEPKRSPDSESKRSVYTFSMPQTSLTLEGLSLSVRATHFDRGYELRAVDVAGHDTLIRTGRLTRGLEPGSRDAQQIAFPAQAVRQLQLSVADGDDAPLELDSARAKVATSALYFAAAPGSYALLSGNPQAEPPIYDLARVRDALLAVDAVTLAPGPFEANPAQHAGATLAAFQRPGSEVDVEKYTWVRECTIAYSPTGLSRLLLAPEDLSRLRSDIGDVRIVDEQRRQRPYLLREDESEQAVSIALGKPDVRGGQSSWKLALPAAPIVVTALVLATEVPFFDRVYRVTARDADDKQVTLAQGRLSRHSGAATGDVVIALRRARVSSLSLVITDGEDAPLSLHGVHVRSPVPALYVVAPPGHYALLLGNPMATAPAYEIARERELVLSLASADASLGELSRNPSHGLRARVSEAATGDLLVWLALGLALVVLTLLTFRLVKRETV